MATLIDLENAVGDFTTSLGNAGTAVVAKQATSQKLAAAQAEDAVSDQAVAAAESDLNAKGAVLKSIVDELAATPPPIVTPIPN